MLFKEEELICFNSVLDGKRIFGTNFSAPQEISKEYIEKTLSQLAENKFLDENKKPTESFCLAVKVLEEYKKSQRYLIMNQMNIAFAKDKKNIICLGKTDKGYEMTVLKKELFLYEYMRNIPFLAEEDSKERIAAKTEFEEWYQDLESPELRNITFLQEFEQNKSGGTYILYQKENQGYLYEPASKQMKRGGSLQFRQLLLKLFQINSKEGVYNGC
ncbi:DUF5081 family protein [Anaerocolumna sp. AGMB13020]|uniref:DUF5081 family protein n=1 Tax=Anaerocolumna sp. AGMB13020 TaxID=3081750 RepID=UPI0029541CCD|nr:DUF5081 family protein [Anaerocolumna sp. AGMB13020]WOO37882.1 DUF5081 family protein [Anaerocolumna sp. AGMB13020]